MSRFLIILLSVLLVSTEQRVSQGLDSQDDNSLLARNGVSDREELLQNLFAVEPVYDNLPRGVRSWEKDNKQRFFPYYKGLGRK
uniref:Uncharacterized protein n=1 Tax=Caenorhabditis japonica TaxID=281687 RepID=A0A8R1IMB8_CAEJA